MIRRLLRALDAAMTDTALRWPTDKGPDDMGHAEQMRQVEMTSLSALWLMR